jgi:hypothetical protein
MPMLWVAVVQAVTSDRFGPFIPWLMERLPGDHVDDAAGHEERRDLARRLRPRGRRVALLDVSSPADARTDRDADALGVGSVDLESGVRMACSEAAMP